MPGLESATSPGEAVRQFLEEDQAEIDGESDDEKKTARYTQWLQEVESKPVSQGSQPRQA